jgi:hypothetical protein
LNQLACVVASVPEICYVVLQLDLVGLQTQILGVGIIERQVGKGVYGLEMVCRQEVTLVDVFDLFVPLAFQGVTLLDNDLK